MVVVEVWKVDKLAYLYGPMKALDAVLSSQVAPQELQEPSRNSSDKQVQIIILWVINDGETVMAVSLCCVQESVFEINLKSNGLSLWVGEGKLECSR